jgi:chromosome segregation ATPase
MMIQVDLWAVIGLAVTLGIAIVGGFWAVAKIAGKQLDEKLEARFDSVEKTLDTIGAERREHGTKLHQLELELANLRAVMPLHYVRREDHIRNQTVIEAKLDALYNKLETVRGNRD